jgi:putative thioredoxin
LERCDVDVTEATFELDVIERSREVPVVVDFWAAWCGPCRQLAPLIEAAVDRREGEVVLAKVDIDANPRLAQTYRVQSIPFVVGFRDGEAVDQFVGMQPPAAIESFLDRLVPSETDLLIAAGDEASLREAIDREPGHAGARLALARLLFAEGRGDEVTDLLAPVAYDKAAEGLLARARLAAVDQPDVVAGLAALDRGQVEPALTHLLDAVRGAPAHLDDLRETMLGVFAELGDQHPLTVRFRRRLAQALY